MMRVKLSQKYPSLLYTEIVHVDAVIRLLFTFSGTLQVKSDSEQLQQHITEVLWYVCNMKIICFPSHLLGRREQVLKDAIAYLLALESRGQDLSTVYDMPILSNIGVSYTVGKLSTSTFQQKYGNLRTF